MAYSPILLYLHMLEGVIRILNMRKPMQGTISEFGKSLETEATKDQRAGHHVGHHERSSVSDAEVPHMNSPLTEIRIRVAELTADGHEGHSHSRTPKCECSHDHDHENKAGAQKYKIAAVPSVLIAGVIGVLFPLLGKVFPSLRPETPFFFVTKAFAAGVILSTGFMHVLPEAYEMLNSPCLTSEAWDFPFTGFIAMVAAILTLSVDTFATSSFNKSHCNASKTIPADGESGELVVDSAKVQMLRTRVIAQGKFKCLSVTIMSTFFAITTPLGIVVGMEIANTYDESSPTALIVQGVLNAASAGILIYMSLVDLLAADFMHPKMQSNTGLQIMAHIALLLGAGLMSILAKWA
ncbi:hypothetical protein Bca101_039923 [Brassica carinata]